MDIVVSETSFMHYGVKGMKWGVRREAKRDAKEAARAKMSYGEGAGNRRKLINESVKAKSKKDPNYKKAFDYYYESKTWQRPLKMPGLGERKTMPRKTCVVLATLPPKHSDIHRYWRLEPFFMLATWIK